MNSAIEYANKTLEAENENFALKIRFEVDYKSEHI
jgi:hypothetical protein